MCQVICCMITAVVQCRSRDGGSPIMAALMTPPVRGASWASAVAEAQGEGERGEGAQLAIQMFEVQVGRRLKSRTSLRVTKSPN